MGVTRLKKDLQLAIANDIKEYTGDYRTLLFDRTYKDYFQSFYFIKEMTVKTDGKKLIYHIKIDENAIKKLSLEDIKIIKKNVFETRVKDILIEKMVQIAPYRFDGNGVFPIEENPRRNEFSFQKAKIDTIQEILRKNFNIETEFKQNDSYLYLVATQKELYFNKEMLNELGDIFIQIDSLAITPQFSEHNSEIIGVRLFLSLNF